MARYTPATVPTGDLQAFLSEELSKIAQSTETADAMLMLDPLFAPPKKFREGAIVFAKAPWTPGSGDGCYMFRAGLWRFLG